jgi:hypothetical protein
VRFRLGLLRWVLRRTLPLPREQKLCQHLPAAFRAHRLYDPGNARVGRQLSWHGATQQHGQPCVCECAAAV